jgi:Leucine-rich repeat (LRR) protein
MTGYRRIVDSFHLGGVYMMRLLAVLLLCFLIVEMVSAQDFQTPYEIALERIEEAESSGATDLVLSGLGLTELPPEIGGLSKLERLYLQHNQLVWLPPEIGNLNALQFLNLQHNELGSLPAEIGMLHNLTELLLSANQLSILPPEIGQLDKLIRLDLELNHLEGMPSQIGDLDSLEELILYLNSLTDIPPGIGNLSHLTILSLGHNQLIDLPSEIGKLRNLKWLDVSHNQLISLPGEIGKLVNLCYLNLAHNQLRTLPVELGQLTLLTASECPLVRGASQSPDVIFSAFYLDGNPLISPPPEVIAQGTPAILAYLRNEAWFYMQKLIVSGLAILGVVTLSVLGLRWRNRRGKQKRKHA